MVKTDRMQVIENRYGQDLKDVLRERIEAGMTLEEIRKELEVSRMTLHIWLREMKAEVSRKLVQTVRFPED